MIHRNNRNGMPAQWQPPAPAWQSYWHDADDPMVTGCFGIQADAPGPLQAWAADALRGEHAPAYMEQGAFVDQAGRTNYLYVAYWRQSAYRRWWDDPRHSDWWRDARRLAEGVGYWREVFTMPLDRFETAHSTPQPHGIAVAADGIEGPILEHGYWGSMRDRIPVSGNDPLRATHGMRPGLGATLADDGQRVLMQPPPNMCVIRSGQDWSLCDDEQKSWYLEQLHPVLLTGMRYLRDNPEQSHCYALRFVDNRDAAWRAMEQSFGLGYATDVHAFENWAREHPTHVAIFGGFMKMVETFGEQLKLRLWHEVTALPGKDCEFEYIACHPDTGLLRYR